MTHPLHFPPHFLNGLLVFYSSFEHLFGTGNTASNTHVKFFGDPLQLDRTVLANAANTAGARLYRAFLELFWRIDRAGKRPLFYLEGDLHTDGDRDLAGCQRAVVCSSLGTAVLGTR